MTPRPLDPIALPLTGQQLIEASAGTGKTYTITTIVLRLLLERGLGLDRIVVVTFTNAATAELRERVRRRIAAAEQAFAAAARGKDPREHPDPVLAHLLQTQQAPEALQRLRAALRSLDRAAIFTIHGFAQRVLQEHAFESGARFDLELVGEQRLLVTEVAHDFWAREISVLPEAVWQALRAFGVSFASIVSLAHVAAAWPDLPLHPAVADESSGDLPSRLDEVARAWDEVADAYARGGDEAFRLLSGPGLNQGTYRRDRLLVRRRELEALLVLRPPACNGIPRAIENLAAGKIKVNKHHQAPQHPLFDALARLASALEACSESTTGFVEALRRRLVHFARERIVAEHDRAGTRSFDDLLYALRDALRDGPKGKSGSLARHLRSRYSAALIDEFQDTDPVQYEIFRRIYGPSPDDASSALFLVGDPKQAIYAFRGADIHAYLQAAREGAGERWTLTTNYRSDPGFVAGLNHLFGRLRQPFLHPEIPYVRVEAAPGRQDALLQDGGAASYLEILYLGREEAGRSNRWDGADEWQRLAAQEIARLLSSGVTLVEGGKQVPVQPRHIAVLTRTNRQAQDIQEHLRTLGIPSVLQGDRTVFETAEASELALILRALAEPSSASAVRTALATRFLGLDANSIAALADDEAAWESWTLRFRGWNGIWAERGLVQCLQALLGDLNVVERTLAQLDGERRMTNFRHLAELLHQAESEKQLRIPGLLQWFDEARLDPVRQGVAPEAQQLRLESDAEAVVLTTMHKSKGLEYPIVVLPFLGARSEPFSSELDNLKFHNPERGERLELDVRAKEHKAGPIERFTREHQAEAMRLAYVALTRARHRCLVLWGGVSPAFSSLGYLLHHPAVELGGLAVDVAARLSGLDDAARFADLEQLAKASNGTIRVRRARLEPAPEYVAATCTSERALEARRLRRPVPAAAHTSSFSALTRGLEHDLPVSAAAREGRDVDEGTDLGATPSVRLPEDGARGDARKGFSVTLADFPKGAKPGELLHAILERAPFAEGDADARQAVVEMELRRHGFARSFAPLVHQALEEVLATPLDASRSWTLGSLRPAAQIREMEFTLPVVLDPASGGVSARALASVLAADGDAAWDREYTRRVARLGFRAWSGFLRGFIDLIFERDGAYYVVDYKSNHLGPTSEEFRRERLCSVLDEHHYHLQYVLYSVALHRYLRQRLPDYSVDRHWGGVYYLFLRGMHPATGPERGVFFCRPSGAILQRVSALLDAEGERA